MPKERKPFIYDISYVAVIARREHAGQSRKVAPFILVCDEHASRGSILTNCRSVLLAAGASS